MMLSSKGWSNSWYDRGMGKLSTVGQGSWHGWNISRMQQISDSDIWLQAMSDFDKRYFGPFQFEPMT